MASVSEDDNIEVEYIYTKDKAYWNKPAYDTIDVTSVKVWVPAVDDWVDVTHLDCELIDQKVNRMIEDDILNSSLRTDDSRQ